MSILSENEWVDDDEDVFLYYLLYYYRSFPRTDFSTPDSVSSSVLVLMLDNKVLATQTCQGHSGSPVLGFARTIVLNLRLKTSGVLGKKLLGN